MMAYKRKAKESKGSEGSKEKQKIKQIRNGKGVHWELSDSKL